MSVTVFTTAYSDDYFATYEDAMAAIEDSEGEPVMHCASGMPYGIGTKRPVAVQVCCPTFALALTTYDDGDVGTDAIYVQDNYFYSGESRTKLTFCPYCGNNLEAYRPRWTRGMLRQYCTGYAPAKELSDGNG